ncbi:ATP-grasp domain-containing protein [Alteromonas flava]|uniref:ATP-grasp domain-containing protein n=1 Tax=Alteromonas flava TaxID=2048003 RepID=UPI0013DBF56B|nr:hypothetical protein [Alteromonas flava]
MRTPITLIIGDGDDPHVQHVEVQLAKRNRQTRVFDTQLFPRYSQIGYSPNLGDGHLVIAHEVIYFDQICSVYWRSLMPLSTKNSIATQDAISMLQTFFAEPSLNWINPYASIQNHKMKPRQLQLAKAMGATIPKSFTGNCPNAAFHFLLRHSEAIFKPVHGGAFTEFVQPDHRSQEYLESVLQSSPVTLQEYIPGTNIRTYVIGNDIFSIEFNSAEVDFRDDNYTIAGAVSIPDPVKNLARRITYSFGMQWSAIDWRCDHEGRYYFLEANPSPMFIEAEKGTGIPLTETFIDLLLEPYNECRMPATR